MDDPFLDVETAILLRAAVLLDGDVVKAREWFYSGRLRRYECASPLQLVEIGRGQELLRYLKSLTQLPS